MLCSFPWAIAHAQSAPSNSSGIANIPCSPGQPVDKEKLAAYLLKTYPVSTAYLSVGDQPAPLSSYRALAAWLLAKRAAEKSAGAGACSGDSCNVDHLGEDLQGLLDGRDPQFKPRGKSDARAFLADGNAAALVCTQSTARPALPHSAAAASMVAASGGAGTAGQATVAATPAPAAAPAKEPSWFDNVRVRGNPDQLSIDRSNAAGYASVERARLSLASDDVAQSRTNDIVVYTGYSFGKRAFGEAGSTYEAVPYVGLKQNRVTVYTDGNPNVTTTRTSQFGMLSGFHFTHADSGNTEDLTARPDYLINNTDGSRLLTVNFTYTPMRQGWLNDFVRWSNGLAFKPILIGQSRNGTYLDRGDPAVYEQHQDFIRLGAQAGFTLASTNPALPFDFTTTFTGLKALQGDRSIHYWKAVLTYNLNQNIGVSLDYSKGLLPDSGDPERKWNVGLSSKF
ncbi:hypothetical protein [Herbaspirillum sp. alder98]|uniref:hypothetical protein n=1 Tax=Herbaspirillum sp. alder98 TaxID=2913096 RepID=UPI001CD825F9|nr:hypothetical protein [Herbaspirillum sp. alder98]MCA1323646.1 hypothetical protein [Herbaspirillum sp. alder98]